MGRVDVLGGRERLAKRQMSPNRAISEAVSKFG